MSESKPTRKASILDLLTSFPGDGASADAVWKQALLLREIAKDDRTASRERRAEATAARSLAEHDAITATKQVCAELQAQARLKLQQAEDALQHAAHVKSDAEAKAARMTDEARAKVEQSDIARNEADSYSEQIRASAKAAADALLAQARAGSQEIVNRMRQETSEEIRRVLADIEVARAAAQDELETQRILAETARIRAFSHKIAEGQGEDTAAPVIPVVPFVAADEAPEHGQPEAAPRAKPRKRHPHWGHPAAKASRGRRIRKVA